MFRVERTEAVDFGKDDAVRCAGIAVRECMRVRAVRVKYLGGGSFGRAAEVRLEDGRAVVVKFLCAADMLEKEQLFCSEVEVQWTCLNCGYVVTSTAAPANCPVCRHPQGYFVRVELAPWA